MAGIDTQAGVSSSQAAPSERCRSDEVDRPVPRARRKLVWLLVLIGVAAALPDRYGMTVSHEANSAGRVYPVQSLVHYGSWSFEDIMCRSGPNHTLVHLSVVNELPYLQKAPGVSWLALPYYAVAVAFNGGDKLPFHWTSTYLGLVCVLPLCLLMAFVIGGEWSRRFGLRPGLLGLLVLMVASPVWIYSTMVQDYALATLGLSAAHVVLAADSRRRLILAGFLLAAAGTINYMFFVYGAAVALVEVVRRQRSSQRPLRLVGWASVGAAVPVIALLTYNAVIWGGPFALSYDYIAAPGQRADHAGVAFSFVAFWDALVGAKQGVLFTSPWTGLGLIGLLLMVGDERHRWLGISGLVVVVLVLGFVSYWNTSNRDSLAFSCHALPMFPWLAAGLVFALLWVRRRGGRAWPLFVGAAAAMVTISFFYQFTTAWSFPYHWSSAASPLWQVNIPLFLSGVHMPLVSLDPDAVRTLDDLGSGHWLAISFTLAAVAAAVGLVWSFWRPGRADASMRVWTPVAFVAVLMVVMLWGMRSDPAFVTGEDRLAELRARVLAGETLPASALAELAEVDRGNALYRWAMTNVLESYRTPQDVVWRDTGHPTSNRWCGVAGVTK